METNRLTLRQLISLIECKIGYKDALFDYLYFIEKNFPASGITREQIVKTYSSVIKELKRIKPQKPFRYEIVVQKAKDHFDKKPYVDVYMLNPDYVKPDENLKPWGGENAPEGYYNCNDEKYNERFAFGYTSWKEVIDTKINVRTPITSHFDWPRILAEILSELTFYGFTEKICKKNIKKLKLRLCETIKTVDEFKKNIKK